MVEVGIAYGYHAETLLSSNPEATYLGVDPYEAGYDKMDPFVQDVSNLFGAPPAEAMDRLHECVRNRLNRLFPGRVEMRRSTSRQVAPEIEDGSIDFVFVDGDHQREAVTDDLTLWWPKVRTSGVLAGDDFTWPDVAQAATAFFTSERVDLHLLSEPESRHPTYFAVHP